MSKRNVTILVVALCLAVTALFVEWLIAHAQGRPSLVEHLAAWAGAK